jgi:hypothetical protein
MGDLEGGRKLPRAPPRHRHELDSAGRRRGIPAKCALQHLPPAVGHGVAGGSPGTAAVRWPGCGLGLLKINALTDQPAAGRHAAAGSGMHARNSKIRTESSRSGYPGYPYTDSLFLDRSLISSQID